MTHSGYVLLWRELRRARGAWPKILAWSFVEALPALLSGLLVSAAIDRFLAHAVPQGLGFLALLLAVASVGALATRQVFPWLAAVIEPVRDAFVVAVVEGMVAEGKADSGGVARLTEQVQSVREMLFAALRIVRQLLFTSVSALVGLALLAPVVALVSAVPLVLALALFACFLPRLAARNRAVLLAEEDVARQAGTAFGGVRDAIACGGQEEVVAIAGDAVRTSARHLGALARVTSVRSLVVLLGGQLPLVVLLVAAPGLLRSGALTIGELVGAITYLTTGVEPALRRIVEVVGTWGMEMIVSVRRLGEGFAVHAPDSDNPVGERADLTVRDLSFAYGPHATPVVDGLGFTLADGEHLAVVGPSGIGKSTLANLLCGLLPPGRGDIMLGGQDVARLRRTDLGLIPQEAYVFTGTVRENLAYLAPDASDATITDAAHTVGLELDRLGGLDARVGVGGTTLSNGEKQLIALTRVYLSPARLVILDEATSNLDPIAEARAEHGFARRPGSLVVIAHRISSVQRADRILLLDGDIARMGTHDELVRTSALYADLVGHWDQSRPERESHVSIG